MSHRLLVFALIAPVLAGAGETRQAYRFDLRFGSGGTANGQFGGISGMVVSGDRLLVADRELNRIQAFTLDGEYLSKFGRFGSGRYELDAPVDVDVDGAGNVYIADSGNYRVHQRTPTYSFLNIFGKYGPQWGEFTQLAAIAVDRARDRLWALNGTHTGWPFISYWTTNGEWRDAFGNRGEEEGDLLLPIELAVDTRSDLYVSDALTACVTRFSRNAEYLGRISECLGRWFGEPAGMVVDAANNLYVVDYQEAIIAKISGNGTDICVFEPPDVTWAELEHVAVDRFQRVYVSNHWNTIERYHINQPPWAPTASWVWPAPAPDSHSLLASAEGASDPDGDVVRYRYQWYVSDNGGVSWNPTPHTARVLPASATSPGERWRVQVRSFDGDAFSAWRTTAAVSVTP